MEKSKLANRSAVAQAMLAAGGKMNLDTAGIAVMQGGIPTSSPAAGCQPAPAKSKKDKK